MIFSKVGSQGGSMEDVPLEAHQTKLSEYYITDAITRSSKVMAKCVKYARAQE